MSQNKEIIVEVTPERFAAQLAEGLSEDEILKAGKHVFRRGGFRARHPDFDSKNSKVRITLEIDHDVFGFYQKRAQQSNEKSAETEITRELRLAMNREAA